MGCNTSSAISIKELPDIVEETSVDVLSADANGPKDDRINIERVKGNEDDDNNEDVDEKSTSAKTITLKSNSRPISAASTSSIRAGLGSVSELSPDTIVTIEYQNTDFLDVEEALAEELAATKIQAAFRGHHTRRNMKQDDSPIDSESSKKQLEADFRADDEELCNAATKIQASFRGHMARKPKEGEQATTPINNAEEELDIDLSDPDLSKAAVKIQASFRSHMSRKEHDK